MKDLKDAKFQLKGFLLRNTRQPEMPCVVNRIDAFVIFSSSVN